MDAIIVDYQIILGNGAIGKGLIIPKPLLSDRWVLSEQNDLEQVLSDESFEQIISSLGKYSTFMTYVAILIPTFILPGMLYPDATTSFWISSN